ncbi:unnamed protein product [Schistosoma rodhaini]|uniref:Plancitoxin-1 n=1 Tax=Schistosoma rodhaini TaxID=6188 RepID=A0AA85G3N8_9TREM|nr:unnamed protein product [Schistosoma rodhaini]CAH8603912.1 unnamed protein product [Schistosoma rodhaini]
MILLTFQRHWNYSNCFAVIMFFSVLFLIYIIKFSQTLSCLDDDGHTVDWFVGYKLPKGYDVVFMNADQRNWKFSKSPINEKGMMKNTFESMFKLVDKPDSVIGMYNDEIPKWTKPLGYDLENLWWGHMKGAFAFDSTNTGFWIIHSIPKLSYTNTSYVYPRTGYTYGQHFLCVTLEKKHLKSLITQFALARPLFQGAYIASSLKSEFPDLAKLLQNQKVFTETQSKVIELQTAKRSFQLNHFSKSSDFGKDLYADFVAPKLKKSLDTETWQHDGSIPSACHRQYSVKNIESIYIRATGTTIRNAQDHAKWAVTVPSKKPTEDTNNWICLGDINRQPHQFERGGGTMCIQDQKLWQSFYDSVQRVEECSRTVYTIIAKRLFTRLLTLIEIVQFFNT